jgi:uncharacterized protein (DUF58 family)
MSAHGRIDQLLDAALVAALDRLDISSRRPLQGTRQGERRSRRRGQGMEFADFRPYAAGDDLRFIDWNIYGRIERLFLRIFLEEEDLSLVVALDESASMGFGTPGKFDVARRVAMGLAYVGLVNQHRVTLAGLRGAACERLEGLRGRRKAAEAANWLLGRQAGGALDFEAGCRALASGRRGRGVVVLVGDFMVEEGLERGLRSLVGRGWDVFALQVLAPEEVEPAAHGIVGDLRLVDSERGTDVEVTVSEALLRDHRQRLQAHNARWRELCTRLGVRQLSIETTADLPRLMLESLRRGGLLR